MKKLLVLLVAVSMVSFTACKKENKENTEAKKEAEATKKIDTTKEEVTKLVVNLESKSGSTATGTVKFEEREGKVTMTAILTGLSEGEHAIHIHEKADCSSDDGKSTGGHWNPTAQPHGKWGAEEGYHKGDIGNFTVNAEGHGTITLTTDQWCIGCGDETKDIIGKAIIVHQGQDDFTTQPTGAAGGRVSCGGIIK